jgi:uncharacterized protein YjbI with pentapeptide repeats
MEQMETRMIGNKIAEARKRANISQAQLAQQLFISAQAVGKWERGESIPDIITFSRLAKILGVDLNYFTDDFPSVTSELASAGSTVKQPDEPAISGDAQQAPGKPKGKLSWDMSRGNWAGADFSGLKNLHEKFSSSNMQRCLFIGSDLSGLLLRSNNIADCDFSGSNLGGSHIQNSNLGGNLFKGCSLNETEFSGSNIGGCDFSGADFTGVTIKACAFEKNSVVQAIWNHTKFINSGLDNIVFDGVIDDCYFENCGFYRVTFRNATLTNTFFKNRSLKRIQFIDCQADRMTFEFLKNGKANLTGLSLLTPNGEDK